MTHTITIQLSPEELKDLIMEAIREHEQSRPKADPFKTMTINQAARRMGRAHTTIQKLVAAGKLKMVDGRITAESIENYYQNHS